MRQTCCCCIPLYAGATVIGALGFVMACFELTPLTSYLVASQRFDPIGNNSNDVIQDLTKGLSDADMPDDQVQTIADGLRTRLWIFAQTEVTLTIAYAVVAALMVLGIQMNIRSLLIPKLLMEMLVIVISVMAGLAVTVAVCMFNVVLGVVSLLVVGGVAGMLIYFWITVRRVYVHMGVTAGSGAYAAPVTDDVITKAVKNSNPPGRHTGSDAAGPEALELLET